jgi:hypothetical protein
MYGSKDGCKVATTVFGNHFISKMRLPDSATIFTAKQTLLIKQSHTFYTKIVTFYAPRFVRLSVCYSCPGHNFGTTRGINMTLCR